MTLDQCVFGFVPFLNRSAIDKQALKVEEVSTVKVQASETSYASISQKHGCRRGRRAVNWELQHSYQVFKAHGITLEEID